MKNQYQILAFAVIITSALARRLGEVRHRNQAGHEVTSLTIVDDLSGAPSNQVSLNACEGHCQNDGECAPGLKCFQRNAFEAVPGCKGSGEMGLNYCYDVKKAGMSLSSTWGTSQEKTLELTKYSRGTLDDSSIEDNRELQSPFFYAPPQGAPSPTPAPVTSPVSQVNLAPDDTPVLFNTASDPPLTIIAQNGQPASAYPLQKCQGTCTSDDDCEGTLKCFHVFQFDATIPGCSGGTVQGSAYCFDDADYPADTNPNTENGGFRLKMYWEEGYLWQDETFDRFWCLECGSFCVVNSCNRPSVSRFEFVQAPSGVQIKLAGQDRCLEKVRTQDIVVMPCDISQSDQWFEGNFDQDKFEMHPYGYSDGCLTQNHHPKAYEYVYMEHCSAGRADTTNFWVKY